MLMPRLSRVFASRWSALWWAAGIIALAWRVASGAEDLSQLAPQAPQPAATAAANPWALDAH